MAGGPFPSAPCRGITSCRQRARMALGGMIFERAKPMTCRSLRRRRFIGILAAAPGMALLPHRAGRALGAASDDPSAHLHVWRGSVLGGDAMMQLHHPDAAA